MHPKPSVRYPVQTTGFAPRTAEAGGALAVFVHVLLLLVVLGQVVYLASRYRVRIDMTSDQLWTSTDSTRRVLDKLEERLIVEAYFSPKEKLPLAMSASRRWADNFLDEITQVGEGRVVVQRFDPNSDKAVADKAGRLGISPLNLSSRSATSLSVDQHWQGLRLVYGGGKQKVIDKFLPDSSFKAEALVTPKIKEVLTGARQRFGFMEWPARIGKGRNARTVGWRTVRNHAGLESRYEFQNVKDEDGALLPAGIETLFLFRPRNLTDRQKYVIDQFVMSGGTLVVFADAAEYTLVPDRACQRVPFPIDAQSSEHSFVQQLGHYGIEWKPKVLADMQELAHKARHGMPEEYFAVPITAGARNTPAVAVAYPYFFHAVNYDWAESADQLAIDATGKVDERKAQQLRRALKPGMPAQDFLFRGFKKIGNRGPGFYWPTWVGLRERAGGVPDLPDGVEGRVLLWSSPLTLLEDPPQRLDPVGTVKRQMKATHEKFLAVLNERLQAETRQQAPLMAEVTGRFSSFFAGKPAPKRPSQIKAEEAAARDGGRDDERETVLEVKPGDPQVGPPLPDAGKADPGKAKSGTSGAAAVGSNSAGEGLTEAAQPGRIVVIGDATFLRDDVLRPDYRSIGGPFSGLSGMPFFAQMLDWLSDDRDLVGLQTRVPADRTLRLVDPTSQPGADPRDAEQALRTKTSWLVWANVLVPGLLLSLFGVGVWFVRRNQKRAFLATLS